MALVGLRCNYWPFWRSCPGNRSWHPPRTAYVANTRQGKGFGLLLAIGALDTSTRMGYLLFLALSAATHEGATSAMVGLGLNRMAG